MSDLYFLLAAVAVLAILSLFRFINAVGCEKVFPLDSIEVCYEATYPLTVIKEPPVAYWRLQEPSSAEPPGPAPPVGAPPVSGGTAKDEMGQGLNPGVYKKIQLAPGSNSAAAPGTLILGVPGLLTPEEPTEEPSTSMEVDGGFVEVPFTSALHAPSFTVEALVWPDSATSNETDIFRTVIESSGDDVSNSPTRGYGIYAGPEDFTVPNLPSVWQVWMGNGSTFQPVIKAPAQHLVFDKPTYLAVTFDGSEITLYVYYANIDNGLFLSSVSFSYQPETTTSLFIGIGRLPPNLFYPFKGKIQEVAVYDKALTKQCVAGHGPRALGL